MFKIIVTDTSPLITLAVADELAVLLLPRIPIEIPDAVYNEATRIKAAPGAVQIGEWINRNSDMVRIVPTQTGIDQQRRLEENRPTRGMGEQAALEAIGIFLDLHPEDRVLLLFEDADIEKRRAFLDERTSLISTGEFLRVLEHENEIPSAEKILDKAAASGRTIEKQRKDDIRNAESRKELQEQIQTTR